MGFYKQYPNRKDWRRPTGRAARSCNPGGNCPYCSEGRQHKHRRRAPLIGDPDVVASLTGPEKRRIAREDPLEGRNLKLTATQWRWYSLTGWIPSGDEDWLED